MGKKTIAICDRCSFQYRLGQLRKQVVARKSTTTMVCPSCLDEDQPQWFGPKIFKPDPAPVPQARPDIVLDEANSGFGWGPVGGMGVFMLTGQFYDFDLTDIGGETALCFDFISQEQGSAIIQEDGFSIDTEMSCLYIIGQEDMFALTAESGVLLVTETS